LIHGWVNTPAQPLSSVLPECYGSRIAYIYEVGHQENAGMSISPCPWLEGIKEAEVDLDGTVVKVAIAMVLPTPDS
jgi:hypothetical protein